MNRLVKIDVSADVIPVERLRPAIRVDDICKSFGEKLILDRITFEVAKGEFVVLLGPSGCGKSTLFRCLTRLIEPDSGRIVIDDTDVTTLRPRELVRFRRQIGFVFQQFNLVKRLTAIDNFIKAMIHLT